MPILAKDARCTASGTTDMGRTKGMTTTASSIVSGIQKDVTKKRKKMNKYEEALQKVRKVQRRFRRGDAIYDILEDIFPRESEEEMVRKELVNFLQSPFIKENLTDEKVAPWLAYLEKQKDLNKMIVVSPEVWDKAISDAFENGKKEGEKQKEQKPAEEITDAEIEQAMDEVTKFKVFAADLAKTFGITYRRDIDWHNFCAGLLTYLKRVQPVEWSEEDNDYYDTIVRKLEVIGDDSGLSNNQIKFLREHCPSHCLEWSEEDKKTINDACCWLAEYAGFILRDNKEKGTMIYKLAQKLKSLRPSWKPSKEQMNGFHTILYQPQYISNSDDERLKQAESLYNDLKKLM